MGKRYCRLLFALATCQPVLPSYSLAGVAQNYRHGLAVETHRATLSVPCQSKQKLKEMKIMGWNCLRSLCPKQHPVLLEWSQVACNYSSVAQRSVVSESFYACTDTRLSPYTAVRLVSKFI